MNATSSLFVRKDEKEGSLVYVYMCECVYICQGGQYIKTYIFKLKKITNEQQMNS